MRPSLLAVLLPLFLVLAAGCSSTPYDETANWGPAELFAEAKEAMRSKDYAKAIGYFEKLEARYPYGRLAQQAQLEVAYAHWKDGERALAVAAIDRFIKLHPNHANVDYAYYLKGLINFNDQLSLFSWLTSPDMSDRDPKSTREAFEAFREVVIRFPDSRYAEDSASRMRYLVNSLASHEVHVARYYMKRGAYLAAANRAQVAIQRYPRAPAVEEAVFVLVMAYDKLGMEELRNDAARVMQTNFPESPYLHPDGLRKDVPWWRLWDPDW